MFQWQPGFACTKLAAALSDDNSWFQVSHRRAVTLMVLVTLLWSLAGVVTRQLDTAHSFEVTFWRSAFNALALAVLLSCMRGAALWRGFFSASRVLWLSGLCWAVMFTAFMVAITLTSVANVLVAMALGPMVTGLFSHFLLDHRLPRRTWLAIFVAGTGIAWMFGSQVGSGAAWSGSLVACIVPLAAAINWTLLQQVGKSGAAGEDMLAAVFIGALLSALLTLPLAWPWQVSAHDLQLLALLGIVQLAIPCLLVVRLSRQLPAAEISLLALLEVIFGVTWAWLWAGEVLSLSVVMGGGLVLAALVFNEVIGMRRPG
jgi:drug/metabolite transporter (DMT)-like permease